MRAYYFDNLPGDQRALHDSGQAVSEEHLGTLGALHWKIPVDEAGNWQSEIDGVAKEKNYKNRDVINITKEGLVDAYGEKLQIFYEEHLHEDEEIRYILDGAGYFDIREHPTNNWFRMHVTPGDLVVVPAWISLRA